MSTGVNPLSPIQIAAQQQSAAHIGYLHKLIKGFDELGNVATGGNLGQSLSSRIGLDAAKGDLGAIELAKLLDLFEADHCVKAEVADETQAEIVVKAEQASPDLTE